MCFNTLPGSSILIWQVQNTLARPSQSLAIAKFGFRDNLMVHIYLLHGFLVDERGPRPRLANLIDLAVDLIGHFLQPSRRIRLSAERDLSE
jgi:hypothetical protein